jgi:hypothetical protein
MVAVVLIVKFLAQAIRPQSTAAARSLNRWPVKRRQGFLGEAEFLT